MSVSIRQPRTISRRARECIDLVCFGDSSVDSMVASQAGISILLAWIRQTIRPVFPSVNPYCIHSRAYAGTYPAGPLSESKSHDLLYCGPRGRDTLGGRSTGFSRVPSTLAPAIPETDLPPPGTRPAPIAYTKIRETWS